MVKVRQELFKKKDVYKARSDGYYMDGYLKSNLDAVHKSVTKKDYDSFIVVTGREGFGKSTLAGQIATYLDPTFTLDRCTFTSQQFQEACRHAKKFQAVVFDETMGYLSSRGAMSTFNKELIKIMSEMRSKNLFVILCIPNFFELDRYPALHRTTGLIHCYKRGRFGSYDYPTKKKLYFKGKKTYSYVVPPNFTGSFRSHFVYDKEKYEEKKQEAINSWLDNKSEKDVWKEQRDKLIKIVYLNDLLPQKKIAKELGLSTRQIGRVCNQTDATT